MIRLEEEIEVEFGNTNREYKDRLFKFIFGNPENREWTLELYNAINGTNYKNAEDIEYNTLDDVVYLGMKNDMSFIIDNEMNLYEHQSTDSPSMPFRFFAYLQKLYDRYANDNNLHVYGTKLQKIPTPYCICFYNGLDKQEDVKVIKMSDMFLKKRRKLFNRAIGNVEIEVVMINVNYGNNKKLLEKCKPLYEYSFFVNRVRSHIDDFKRQGKSYTLEDAVDKAIEDLPKDFKILEFIMKNRKEIKAMFLLEYDQERHMRQEREEGIEIGMEKGLAQGRAEGLADGLAKGREKNMLDLLNDGLINEEVVAKKLGITIDEVKAKLKDYKANK